MKIISCTILVVFIYSQNLSTDAAAPFALEIYYYTENDDMQYTQILMHCKCTCRPQVIKSYTYLEVSNLVVTENLNGWEVLVRRLRNQNLMLT